MLDIRSTWNEIQMGALVLELLSLGLIWETVH